MSLQGHPRLANNGVERDGVTLRQVRHEHGRTSLETIGTVANQLRV